MFFRCILPHDFIFFFFNDTATTEIYTLSLHDALPISSHLGPKVSRSFLTLGRVEGILGHLYRGGVYHLAFDADGAGPGGVRLLVGGDDLSRPLDLFFGGREDLVDGLDLSRVDAPLAVKA